jgi:hypothetical protein
MRLTVTSLGKEDRRARHSSKPPDDPLFDRPPVIGPLTRPLDPDEDPEDDRADELGEQEEGEA